MSGVTSRHEFRASVPNTLPSQWEAAKTSAAPGRPFGHTSAKSFRRGEIIAGPGHPVDAFAEIQKGTVSASAIMPDGREFILDVVSAGGWIGDLHVLRTQTLNVEYRAMSDCVIWFFKGSLLREKIASDPVFQDQVLQKLLSRVFELESRLVANAGSSLQSRLSAALLRLSAINERHPMGDASELIISQHQLASILPASREKVNQCLGRLRGSNIIDGGQGKIRILNKKALQCLANGID